MCVLYVSFGSKIKRRTFGCIAMSSAVLFILMSRLLLYSAGSGVHRVQVVLSGFGGDCFVLSRNKLYVVLGCTSAFDMMVMSSTQTMT